MQQNILRDSNITKIYLVYADNGSRKRESVKLRFMDSKECFFATPVPVNFQKPKKKTPAEIYVYTTDGVYKTQTSILESNLSMNEVIYEVTIPRNWDFIQVRSSTRKLVELPFTIKFNDGFEIKAATYDLSLGGVSFYLKESVSSIYKKISGIITLEFPSGMLISFPDNKLVTEVKFVREKNNVNEHGGDDLFVYKFLKITPDEEEVLKNYLIKLV